MTTNGVAPTGTRAAGQGRGGERALTAAEVWRQLEKRSFAVLAYVTPDGEPRSSGVGYGVEDRRLFVAVAPESWKARHIRDGQRVSLTVAVPAGGPLGLVFPIPPATISFGARATVRRAGATDTAALPRALARLLPEARRSSSCILELVPEGRFLTYGIGVPLRDLADPVRAGGRVPVS